MMSQKLELNRIAQAWRLNREKANQTRVVSKLPGLGRQGDRVSLAGVVYEFIQGPLDCGRRRERWQLIRYG